MSKPERIVEFSLKRRARVVHIGWFDGTDLLRGLCGQWLHTDGADTERRGLPYCLGCWSAAEKVAKIVDVAESGP